LKIDNIDVEAAIKNVQALLETDESLKAALDLLLLLVTLLINQRGLNSKNSNIPPSSDPNRKKVSKAKSASKPGGQKGSKGTTPHCLTNCHLIASNQLSRHLDRSMKFSRRCIALAWARLCL
jgi:hypothetical protein